MSAMDKDLAATLTPEELEAINSNDDDSVSNTQDQEALKALAGRADTDTDGDDDDDNGGANAAPVEGKGAAPDKTKVEQGETAVDDKVPAAKDDEGGNDDPQPKARKNDFVPKYQASRPENYEETIAELKESETQLKQRFKAGEIEFDEFEEARGLILDQRNTLEKAAFKAEISQEMGEQFSQQTWENTVNGYIDSVKAEIDYTKDDEKAADFDQFVKVLAASPKHQDKSMEWFLQEGHRRVKALHGLTSAPAKDETPAPKANTSRKPPIDAAPKNLSQVPGGDGPGDVEDEFSDMDRLEGEDLELAIAKMTPAQRERYLQA